MLSLRYRIDIQGNELLLDFSEFIDEKFIKKVEIEENFFVDGIIYDELKNLSIEKSGLYEIGDDFFNFLNECGLLEGVDKNPEYYFVSDRKNQVKVYPLFL